MKGLLVLIESYKNAFVKNQHLIEAQKAEKGPKMINLALFQISIV